MKASFRVCFGDSEKLLEGLVLYRDKQMVVVGRLKPIHLQYSLDIQSLICQKDLKET